MSLLLLFSFALLAFLDFMGVKLSFESLQAFLTYSVWNLELLDVFGSFKKLYDVINAIVS